MLGLSFFGRQKNRQFNYIPRYYDPKKEEREERKRRVLGTEAPEPAPDEKYVPGSYIRRARMNRMSVAPPKEQRKKTFVIRFIVVLAILFVLAYAIIYSEGVQLFIERLITK